MSGKLDEKNLGVREANDGPDRAEGGNVSAVGAPQAVMTLTSPITGKQFTITRTNELDAYELPLQPATIANIDAETAAAPPTDDFAGSDRRMAKLSVGTGVVQPFAKLEDLDAFLPNPNGMLNHHPPITKDSGSGRVIEEQQNVQVSAFLYAASRENDNDFHLIIGNDPGARPRVCMNMEVSGLPSVDDESFQALSDARTAFKNFFGEKLPGRAYYKYNPPIPLKIQGSLFFDVSHVPGEVGPPELRNQIRTVWEVHPITSIEFEK